MSTEHILSSCMSIPGTVMSTHGLFALVTELHLNSGHTVALAGTNPDAIGHAMGILMPGTAFDPDKTVPAVLCPALRTYPIADDTPATGPAVLDPELGLTAYLNPVWHEVETEEETDATPQLEEPDAPVPPCEVTITLKSFIRDGQEVVQVHASSMDGIDLVALAQQLDHDTPMALSVAVIMLAAAQKHATECGASIVPIGAVAA